MISFHKAEDEPLAAIFVWLCPEFVVARVAVPPAGLEVEVSDRVVREVWG